MTDTYDPRTCLTAGEVRAIGVELPESVPDCAWVPRWAMRTELGKVTDGDTPGSVDMMIGISFSVPFTWIELKIEVDAE